MSESRLPSRNSQPSRSRATAVRSTSMRRVAVVRGRRGGLGQLQAVVGDGPSQREGGRRVPVRAVADLPAAGNSSAGQFVINGAWTRRLVGRLTAGLGWLTSCLGVPSTYSQATLFDKTELDLVEQFLRAGRHPSERLTVNLGVRLDHRDAVDRDCRQRGARTSRANSRRAIRRRPGAWFIRVTKVSVRASSAAASR